MKITHSNSTSLANHRTTLKRMAASLSSILPAVLSPVLFLAACSTVPTPIPTSTSTPSPTPPTAKPSATTSEKVLETIAWADLPGWQNDDLRDFWAAWQQNCKGLVKRKDGDGTDWPRLCAQAASINGTDSADVRRFIESNFIPQRIMLKTLTDGTVTGQQTQGLITGYYEPVYKGSRARTNVYSAALYAPPADLITVELGSLYPELKNQRVRGRLFESKQGTKLIPYLSRAEIAQASNKPPFSGKELAWLDPLDAFFIEVQGSGRVEFEDGKQLRVGYADQNGHPYKSIGRWLVDQGELTLDQASAQNIREWAKKNPQRRQEMLNANPSQVFFRELTNLQPSDGPLGALGVPLVAQRAIAIDPKFIALGSLIYLNTTYPNTTHPLQRLMIAQDTGGAIRGAIRADYYWGTGHSAGEQAGKMRQQGEMYLLTTKPDN